MVLMVDAVPMLDLSTLITVSASAFGSVLDAFAGKLLRF